MLTSKSLSRSLLLTSALILFITVNAHAFNIGGLKDKAAAVSEKTGGSELATIGKSLYSAFSGNELATKYAKNIVSSLQSGKYSKVFDQYNKLKNAGLSPEQLTSWNGIKNTISAFVLENGISTENETTSDLIAQASAALKGNQFESATTYLKKLKSLGSLAKSETSLLNQIQANVLPLVIGK